MTTRKKRSTAAKVSAVAGFSAADVINLVAAMQGLGVKALRVGDLHVIFKEIIDTEVPDRREPSRPGRTQVQRSPAEEAPKAGGARASDAAEVAAEEMELLAVTDPVAWEKHMTTEDGDE